MKPQGSLTHSQKAATCPYPEQHDSEHDKKMVQVFHMIQNMWQNHNTLRALLVHLVS